jgi:hypothetical protein
LPYSDFLLTKQRKQQSSPPKKKKEEFTFHPDLTATRNFPKPMSLSVTEVECYNHFRQADRAVRQIEIRSHDRDGCTFRPENPNAARRERLAQRRMKRVERPKPPEEDPEEEELRRIQQVRDERTKYLKSLEKTKKSPFRIPFEREKFVEIDVPQRTIRPW